MRSSPFLAAALPLLLACPALAKNLPSEAVARGNDGPAGATCEELTSQEALDRWASGLTLHGDKTLVLIALGTQPAGTRVVGAKVRETDKYGWTVKIRVRATVPAWGVKGIARPYVILSFPGSPMRVEHDVRVRLQMGDTTFQTMSLEAAGKTRAKLARMTRKQRRQVARLNAANRARRERLAELEQQVLAFDKAPAYVAAERGRSFEDALRRGVKIASIQTDLHFFGTTMNPMVTTGDESLKYLYVSKRTKIKTWSKEIDEAYATEAKAIEKAIGELESLLASMQKIVADHAAKQDAKGLVGGVSKR